MKTKVYIDPPYQAEEKAMAAAWYGMPIEDMDLVFEQWADLRNYWFKYATKENAMNELDKARKAFWKLPISSDAETIADMVWAVQHELDLLEEGEENDFSKPAQVKAARKFLVKYKGA